MGDRQRTQSTDIAKPTAAPGAARLEIHDSSAFEKALDAEYQALGETIKSYVIFAIALYALVFVQANFGFFYVLAVFAIFFVATVHVKAYLSALRGTPTGAAGRTLLSNFLLLNEMALMFVTILLVQIVMARATPFFSDGHFSFDRLVLPLLFFASFFGEWYARRARVALDTSATNKNE